MSIDDIMQSFDAIILLTFMVFIGISAILLIPDLIEPHTMFDPRQMRNMAVLEHTNHPQSER